MSESENILEATETVASVKGAPTERQYDTLIKLGSGSALLTGTKRMVDPLLRRGWVTADHGYAWVRITADGLHALALGVEKFGLPEMKGATIQRRVCGECGNEWRPKCRCGGRAYRYEFREVERALDTETAQQSTPPSSSPGEAAEETHE